MNLNCDDNNSIKDKFAAHMSEHGLSYATKDEYDFRLDLFTKKDEELKKINERHSSFQVGHNMFSTMTKMEFAQRLGHLDDMKWPEGETIEYDIHQPLKESVDWRTVPNVVNPVKNQAHCGSCWAFSATGTLESANAIATGKLLNLSEQQLVSCEPVDNGCNGGLSVHAFEWMKSNPQELGSDYPYSSSAGQVAACQYDKSKGKVTVRSWAYTQKESVKALKQALMDAPVSVSVQADQPVFHQYKSGIIDTEECGTELDHAIIAVGYGSENGKDYFIVRNSWTTKWGEEGYARIAAVEGKGICGI